MKKVMFFQQCGKVPMFDEKCQSKHGEAPVIPFIVAVNPHGEGCGCSRPNAESLGNLFERLMLGCEEQHKAADPAADPALIKAIRRHQPVKLPRELYELDVQTVQTVELKVD